MDAEIVGFHNVEFSGAFARGRNKFLGLPQVPRRSPLSWTTSKPRSAQRRPGRRRRRLAPGPGPGEPDSTAPLENGNVSPSTASSQGWNQGRSEGGRGPVQLGTAVSPGAPTHATPGHAKPGHATPCFRGAARYCDGWKGDAGRVSVCLSVCLSGSLLVVLVLCATSNQ